MTKDCSEQKDNKFDQDVKSTNANAELAGQRVKATEAVPPPLRDGATSSSTRNSVRLGNNLYSHRFKNKVLSIFRNTSWNNS